MTVCVCVSACLCECLLLACLTSSVSQGRMYSDYRMRYRTEMEVAIQTFYHHPVTVY